MREKYDFKLVRITIIFIMSLFLFNVEKTVKLMLALPFLIFILLFLKSVFIHLHLIILMKFYHQHVIFVQQPFFIHYSIAFIAHLIAKFIFRFLTIIVLFISTAVFN